MTGAIKKIKSVGLVIAAECIPGLVERCDLLFARRANSLTSYHRDHERR
jgi:hypothetical protein